MRFVGVFLVVALWLPLAAAAEEAGSAPVKPEDAENCVGLSRIDRTRIVDDQTILFYMRGGDIFVNRLPRRCVGLKRADSYTYATSLTQLCNTDIIRVLERFGGSLPRPGIACGLGFFSPITPEAVDLLLGKTDDMAPEAVDPELEAPEAEESGQPEIEAPAADDSTDAE